jgi:subtilisin family serine protease
VIALAPLALADFEGRTGRGVRIAVVDSGVHAAHPHVGGVFGGVAFDGDGREHEDVVDRLGHGTAVAAAIREKAPEAEILAVKVFDRSLSATGTALVRAIEWAVAHGADLVNLSLGTTNEHHRAPLAEAVARASAAGAIVVAAAPEPSAFWLPGALPGVVAVEVDWDSPRDECRVSADGLRLRASGYPRPIPGVSPERNLKGLSFAVANVTGLLALALERGQTQV